MERQLKAPYIPPKNKMISDMELKKMEALSKRAIDEIDVNNIITIFLIIFKHQNEIAKGVFKNYKREQAKDPNWDKSFQN